MRVVFSIVIFLCPLALGAQSIHETLRALNSAYDEQNPVLSPDGQMLFFTIGNHPGNVAGKKDPGDIWFSQKEGVKWLPPVHAGSALNNGGYNAVAGYSPDGSMLFLHGHYSASGNSGSQGISVSRNTGSGWSRPENINIPYFMNKSGIVCGSLSPDNSVFIFSAESYGTHGVDDLYVSVKEQGNWTAPKNLGSMINTQFQELSPSVSEDKKTLFFSSNGRKGEGSFDIFTATRLDDSWTNWSIPANLGPQINSEGRELFYRFYPASGVVIYTTTKSSDGYGDVRVYVPQEPLPTSDTAIYASIAPNSAAVSVPVVADQLTTEASNQEVIAPEKMLTDVREVKVYGNITNAKTGEPIAAKISFEGPAIEPRVLVASDGGYSVAVPTAPYTIRIEANGFISVLEKLDINALDMRDLEMNFKLQPVELGTKVNLKSVLFAQTKTDILPESYPELDMVVTFLRENPSVRIELMGHTDGRGVHADNVKLSQQRVNKVKEYLVERGIEGRRISGKGFGGSKPIASNDTEESRRMNRRVEFVITRSSQR